MQRRNTENSSTLRISKIVYRKLQVDNDPFNHGQTLISWWCNKISLVCTHMVHMCMHAKFYMPTQMMSEHEIKYFSLADKLIYWRLWIARANCKCTQANVALLAALIVRESTVNTCLMAHHAILSFYKTAYYSRNSTTFTQYPFSKINTSMRWVNCNTRNKSEWRTMKKQNGIEKKTHQRKHIIIKSIYNLCIRVQCIYLLGRKFSCTHRHIVWQIQRTHTALAISKIALHIE